MVNPTDDKEREEAAKRAAAVSVSPWTLLWSSPGEAIGQFWQAFYLWRISRPWIRLKWMVPLILLLLVCIGMVAWGALRPKGSLLQRYVEQAESVASMKQWMKKAGAASPGDVSVGSSQMTAPPSLDQEFTPEQIAKAELLYQRVVQMDPNHPSANFFIALRSVANGDLARARLIMSRLASASGGDFAPAHAWMAGEYLNDFRNGNQAARVKFAEHAKAASQWELVSPELLLVYSQYLEQTGEPKEAVALVKKAAQRDPRLHLATAELAIRCGMQEEARQAAERLLLRFQDRLGTAQELPQDRLLVAQSHMLLEHVQQGIDVLQQGLAVQPQQAQWRRALSDIHRLRYRRSIPEEAWKTPADPIEFPQPVAIGDLTALEEAARIDPENPSIGDELSQRIFQRWALSPALDQILDEQLQKDVISPGALLVLANHAYRQGDVDQAILHWEHCLKIEPKTTLAINNLSVAISRKDPTQTDRAILLIDQAIEQAGASAELLDSRGTILQIAGRHNEAIGSLERALAISPERQNTRRKLIESYRVQGLESLAKAQESLLESGSKEPKGP